jgi:hypothetical protein
MDDAEDIEGRLVEIERAIDAGATDLAALGFWPIVRRAKADPALAARIAERVERIDRRAFEARVHPRAPVWAGNLALLAGVAAGVATIVVARTAESDVVAGIALIAAAALWSVAVHDLAHWAVGAIVGIRFLAYFLGGPPPPRPGLKTRYGTYLRASSGRRAWMHASGAIATKLAPFVTLALYPSTRAPAWAAWIVLAIGVAQIVTDVVFSTRSSDWMRFSRELAIGRSGPT